MNCPLERAPNVKQKSTNSVAYMQSLQHDVIFNLRYKVYLTIFRLFICYLILSRTNQIFNENQLCFTKKYENPNSKRTVTSSDQRVHVKLCSIDPFLNFRSVPDGFWQYPDVLYHQGKKHKKD